MLTPITHLVLGWIHHLLKRSAPLMSYQHLNYLPRLLLVLHTVPLHLLLLP
jgi:hypothetical protein